MAADSVQPVTVSLDDLIGNNPQTRDSGDGRLSFTGENKGNYPSAVSADPASRYCFTGARPYSTQGMPQQLLGMHRMTHASCVCEALSMPC